MSIKVKALANNAAEVNIDGQIGESWYGDGITAKRFRDDLKALGTVDHITVRMNSPGGEVFDGFSIYNALRESKARVTVLVDGLAASIASVIAMAGDEIVMGVGSMFMVHSPWTVAMGDAEDMRQVADMLDKVKVGLTDAYVLRTGQARKTVEGWMDGETWFTRDEALAAGLATGLADFGVATEPAPGDATAAAAAHVPVELLATKAAASAHFRAFASTVKPFPIPAAKPVSQPASAEAIQELKTMPKPNDGSAEPTNLEVSAAVLAAETNRRGAIRAAFGRFADQHRALLDKCLDDHTCTAEAASAALLAKLGEGAESLVPTRQGTGAAAAVVTRDERDKFVEGASASLLARSGHGKQEPGNEFNGMTLTDLAAAAIVRAGGSVRGLTRDGIARKVLGAGMSSSDFPNLLSSTAGKLLRNAYGNFPNTWNKVAAKGSVSDFKVHPRIQLGAFTSLATIPEGGEYKQATTTEEYENASAVTKGRYISMTRQMLVNDDLGGFGRRAMLLGRAAARSINNDLWAYITSGANNRGPTNADTGQFFNATTPTATGSGHANLTTSGTALTVASLGVGRVAMRKQKDKSVLEVLNIEPAVLAVPVGKEDLALQLMASQTDPSSSNANVPNIYKGRFEVVSDPYLDSISATAWYLFANPNDIAAFEVVFLDGNDVPFIDEQVEFMTDALQMKVRLDYGTAPGDWRAGYKNEGA